MDFSNPYDTRRGPLLSRNAVATSQPLAAQAGLAMLYQGGNAVDAALAAAIALTVVEPTGNGLGSDAFAIVWDGAGLHGLNASGRSPHYLNGLERCRSKRFLRRQLAMLKTVSRCRRLSRGYGIWAARY